MCVRRDRPAIFNDRASNPRGPHRSRTNVAMIDKILRMGEGKILRQLKTISKQVNAV